MTTARNGLAAALARTSSGAVLALAEMSTEDLLAGLSDEQKAGLSASLAAGNPPAAAASEVGDEDDLGGDKGANCASCKEPMKDGKCAKCEGGADAQASDPVAAARAEERNRFTAVMSSEHYKGREQAASAMLANDKLSADEIITVLAASVTSPASANDGDDAARAAMREAIESNQNSNIDAANGGANTSSADESAKAWARAIALNNPQSV